MHNFLCTRRALECRTFPIYADTTELHMQINVVTNIPPINDSRVAIISGAVLPEAKPWVSVHSANCTIQSCSTGQMFFAVALFNQTLSLDHTCPNADSDMHRLCRDAI